MHERMHAILCNTTQLPQNTCPFDRTYWGLPTPFLALLEALQCLQWSPQFLQCPSSFKFWDNFTKHSGVLWMSFLIQKVHISVLWNSRWFCVDRISLIMLLLVSFVQHCAHSNNKLSTSIKKSCNSILPSLRMSQFVMIFCLPTLLVGKANSIL